MFKRAVRTEAKCFEKEKLLELLIDSGFNNVCGLVHTVWGKFKDSLLLKESAV